MTTAPDEIRLTEHDDFAWTTPADNYAVSTEVQELIDTHRKVASDPTPGQNQHRFDRR